MEKTFDIKNTFESELVLHIEPWGEQFVVSPKEIVTLGYRTDADYAGHLYSLVVGENLIEIWFDRGATHIKVNGALLASYGAG